MCGIQTFRFHKKLNSVYAKRNEIRVMKLGRKQGIEVNDFCLIRGLR